MTPRKKKRKIFRAVKAVKAAAREQLGSPPPTRREEPPTRRAREKHKATLDQLLSED